MLTRYLLVGGVAMGIASYSAASLLHRGKEKPPGGSRLPHSAKLAPNLQAPGALAGSSSYIVQFRDARKGAEALRGAGVRVVRQFRLLPMAAVTASAPQLTRLLASPAVTHVSSDFTVKRSMEHALPAVSADLAQRAGNVGTNVGIAVVDSGVTPHFDLGDGDGSRRQRTIAGYDFVKGNQNFKKNDDCGHGTLVAGIAAGNGAASNWQNGAQHTTRNFRGVAPDANIINLRVLNKHGIGSVNNAIAALEWCILNKARYNVRVVNMSLGHAPQESYRNDPLCQAAEAAWKAGIVVVCAAGNRGRSVPSDPNSVARYGTINSPGNSPYVLTVGATKDNGTPGREDDWVASYSSRGPTLPDHIMKPDVLAPGNRIISLRQRGSELENLAQGTNLIPLSYYVSGVRSDDRTSREYFHLSGTSMAAAVVSGAVAVMIANQPDLTPDTVKARLMLSARKTWRADGKTPNIFSRGAGLIDLARALRCPIVATKPALSPWAERVDQGVLVHVNQGLGGEATFWGDRAVWANPSLFAQQALWADEETFVPSGDSAQPIPSEPGDSPGNPGNGDQALWADGGLWSDQQTWSGGMARADQSLWAQQALWADDASFAIAEDPQDQALWADRSLYADNYLTSPQYLQLERALWAQQALWADQEETVNGGGSGIGNEPGGNETGGTGGETGGDGSGELPPSDPGNGGSDQALWADIFRLGVTGEN